jgi:plastocyanin
MKKALLLLAPLAVASAATMATAADSSRQATATVSITATGFNPDDVTIRPGDNVTWKNNDTSGHQVVSDVDAFKSPVLKPGETWTHRFEIESSYSYHDATKASVAGAVHVLASKVTVGVTRIRAVYRNPVRIFGSIPNGESGQTVTIHIKPYRKPEITKNVVTSEGTYELMYRPTLNTEVFATWNNTTSESSPRVGVRPLVVFRVLNRAQNLFFVRINAAKSYAHKVVRINRQSSSGRWFTTRIIRLNRFGEKRFTGRFPFGTTKAQAVVGKTPGYMPGFSVIKLVSR